MKFSKRALMLVLLVGLALSIPALASASKNVWKARLSTSNELHEVVGSSARGGTNLTVGTNGWQYSLSAFRLSGSATGVHIHGPATETENGPVVITLCGGPEPTTGACPALDSSGILVLQSELSSSEFQPGITGAEFQEWLENGLLYVNVHTDLNPAGEIRGTLLPR